MHYSPECLCARVDVVCRLLQREYDDWYISRELSLKQRCSGPSPLGCANTIVLIGNATLTPVEPLDLANLDCSSLKVHSHETAAAVEATSTPSGREDEDDRLGFKLKVEVYGAGKLAVGALVVVLGIVSGNFAVHRMVQAWGNRRKARSA